LATEPLHSLLEDHVSVGRRRGGRQLGKQLRVPVEPPSIDSFDTKSAGGRIGFWKPAALKLGEPQLEFTQIQSEPLRNHGLGHIASLWHAGRAAHAKSAR
jgi:hypothetical protein